MNITKKIVKQIEKELKCPILEIFYTKEDKHWYVCFDEYITKKGKDQIVHIDDVLKELEKYNNIKYLTHETYIDDEGDWFEQISFQWQEDKNYYINR